MTGSFSGTPPNNPHSPERPTRDDANSIKYWPSKLVFLLFMSDLMVITENSGICECQGFYDWTFLLISSLHLKFSNLVSYHWKKSQLCKTANIIGTCFVILMLWLPSFVCRVHCFGLGWGSGSGWMRDGHE